MIRQGYPQPILLRLSDVSDVSANTAHRSAYVTTTLPAIVQGLRNLECQPDPFNEFQGPDALFSRLLAGLVGTTEYDAVMGTEVERLNALLAEQVEKVESLRQDVARLTQERDDARADFEQSSQDLQTVTHHGKLAEQDATTLRRERDEARARLDAIASISHDGGLLNMTEADVCVAVRRLSIPNWSADSIHDRERRVADSCRLADKTYRERTTTTPGAQP